jgi:hypothetical protein
LCIYIAPILATTFLGVPLFLGGLLVLVHTLVVGCRGLRLGAATGPAALGQSPRLGTYYLAFAIGHKVDDHADQVVEGGVGALVHEDRGERRQRQDGEAELERAVDGAAGEEAKWPLEGEHAQAEDEVHRLEDRNGANGGVERPREKVPEDLGPEVARDGGGNLV